MSINKEQIEKYADVMIWGMETARKCRGGRFKKGDVVLVKFDILAMELAEAIHRKLMGRGANVLMKCLTNETMEYDFYNLADTKQLKFVGPWEETYCESLNGSIFLSAPASLTHLKDIDPKRMSTAAVSRKHLRDILNERESKGLYGWTLCGFPTKELAKQAGMSITRYSNQIAKSCYLNEEDPVAKWISVYKNMDRICKWINKLTKDVKHFHIESKNTDMIITPGEKRAWKNGEGVNIPSFELFMSPDWRGTSGTYHADMPTFRGGNYIKGVTLKFEKGRAVSIKADEGEEYLVKTLNTDRGACQVGEFSLTDKRFSKIDEFMAEILYDENYGGKYGNCHIAVGSSYTETYDGPADDLTKEVKSKLGFNDSAIHWDLINGEDKTVTAHFKDGNTKVIYEKGEFTY
jgi:aminopeptidase